MTFSCFQCAIVTTRHQLQGKLAEMENFASHLEEIFLTVEVNIMLCSEINVFGKCIYYVMAI